MPGLRFGPKSTWLQNTKPHPAWRGIPCLERSQAVPLCALKGLPSITWIQRRGRKLSMRVPMAESQTCHFWLCELHISQICSLEHTSFILTVKAFWLDYICAVFSSKMLWFSKVNDSFCTIYWKRTGKPNLTVRFEWYILVSILSVFHLAIFCVPFFLQILLST